MQTGNIRNNIRRILTLIAVLAALLGLLAGISIPARGNELSVEHSGAAALWLQVIWGTSSSSVDLTSTAIYGE